MGKWSKELQNNTLENIRPGAMVKDEDHNYGFVTEIEPKVIIKDVLSGGFISEPGDETIATFNSALDMVEAGWVLD